MVPMVGEERTGGQERPHASILHVDMDSFFVSVELLSRPELRGIPTAVGGATGRSVIASASYEARRYGVRSAMPVARARQLCPDLVMLPPNFAAYRAASREVMRLFQDFTPLVEPLSIDEAFLDVAGSLRLFGTPADIARELRRRVRAETGLPASVGLATTKHVAKLASQRAKPDGVLEIPPGRTLAFLHPLPVEAIWGVGGATARALHGRAIHTVGDLAREPLDALARLIGRANATRLHHLANGRDAREVTTARVEKSFGHEETFAHDVTDPAVLQRELLRLAARTAERLRGHHAEARTIGLKLRWSDFQTITRSRTLADATSATQRIYRTALELLDDAWPPGRPVRLIGVRAEHFVPEGSGAAALWDEDTEWKGVDRAADAVRQRFGDAGLRPARLLEPRDDVVDPRSLEPPA